MGVVIHTHIVNSECEYKTVNVCMHASINHNADDGGTHFGSVLSIKEH